MHVKARQVAFLGLLAAINSILIFFASLFESNTLFLLVAASYLVGIAIQEFGLRIGTGFFVACTVLGFLLSPNKLYVLTYLGFSLYIVWYEVAYWRLSKMHNLKLKQISFFLAKLIFFNIVYLSSIFLFPQLLVSVNMSNLVILIIIVGGQVGWLIFDKAYEYFLAVIWGKFRRKIAFLF